MTKSKIKSEKTVELAPVKVVKSNNKKIKVEINNEIKEIPVIEIDLRQNKEVETTLLNELESALIQETTELINDVKKELHIELLNENNINDEILYEFCTDKEVLNKLKKSGSMFDLGILHFCKTEKINYDSKILKRKAAAERMGLTYDEYLLTLVKETLTEAEKIERRNKSSRESKLKQRAYMKNLTPEQYLFMKEILNEGLSADELDLIKTIRNNNLQKGDIVSI